MNARQLRRDALPPHLVELYKRYSFTGVDMGFAYAYDSVQEWAGETAILMDRMYSVARQLATADARLGAQEKEFADKMQVCWRLRGFGTLATPDPSALSKFNADQARLLTPELRRRATAYISWMNAQEPGYLAELLNAGPVVLDKGKGAPYWSPGSDREVAFAYGRLTRGVHDFETLQRRTIEAGGARMPFCQTSYIRIQSARKATDSWYTIGDRLEPAPPSIKPKVRRIGAQPFIINHLWAGVGHVLRTAMASIDDRTTGTVGPAAMAVGLWPFAAAYDLASYDTTVSLETLSAVRTHLLEPVLAWLLGLGVIELRDYQLLMSCDEHTQTLPILVPPMDGIFAAQLVQAAGQTRSGENLTSWKGTEINRARIRAKAAHLHLVPDVDYAGYNYGDDTILVFKSAASVDRWAELQDFAGFTETLAPDVTFLMRRLPHGYGYLGRMLMACVNREMHQEPLTALGAASAIATRRELLRGHPAAGSFIPTLRDASQNERLADAIAMADAGASAADLSLAAAREQMALNSQLPLDPFLQQLRTLQAPDVYIGQLTAELALKRRLVRWSSFQHEVDQIPLKDAQRLIASRSYTLSH